jgi:hypothetical protein
LARACSEAGRDLSANPSIVLAASSDALRAADQGARPACESSGHQHGDDHSSRTTKQASSSSTDQGGGSGGLVSSRPRAAERLKGIGKLSESSLPRCPKATTVAWKQENAFARQTAATIARTDGRGSFWPKLGSCWQRPKRSQRTVSKDHCENQLNSFGDPH